MGAMIEIVQIEKSALEDLIYRTAKKAYEDAKAEEKDQLLNKKDICLSIPGMTLYLLNKLVDKHKLRDVQGRYSLADVKAAMRSQKR